MVRPCRSTIDGSSIGPSPMAPLTRQHPPEPYGSTRGGLLRPRERLRPSRAMRHRYAQARRDTELLNERTKFLQNPVAQNDVSHDRSRGRRGSASCQVALLKPSRVDELPMSARIKYGAEHRVRQHVFWSFLDSRKSPVKPCKYAVYDTYLRALIP